MKGKILRDKILIKQEDAIEKTAGGILIPSIDNEKPQQGIVVVVGKNIAEIEAGDTVFFTEHSGHKVKLEEKELSLEGEFVLLQESNVLFIKQR